MAFNWITGTALPLQTSHDKPHAACTKAAACVDSNCPEKVPMIHNQDGDEHTWEQLRCDEVNFAV